MNTTKRRLVKISTLLVVAGMIVWMSAGCATQQQMPLDELFSPTPSLTTMATVDWFPMTATPQTVVPATATPNPAASPQYGQSLFSDPFTQMGNWQNLQTANGIVSVADGAITLAVKKAPATLAVVRQDSAYDNFYLETTVKRVALCKNDDEIGLLFRVSGEQSYYRLVVDCQGLLALQQVVGGTPTMLANWTPSEQIPAGLWKSFTLGVWANGQEIRIYVNGQLQTEVIRDTFKSGGIGYFARTAGDTPLTVSFSDLTLYQVSSSSAANAAVTITP
jgi:hypothetical protein